MNQILYSKKAQKTKIMILSLILVLLLLVLGFFGFGFVNANGNRITNGVFINSVEVGNMTALEAEQTVAGQKEKLSQKRFVLVYGNRETEVSGADIGLTYATDLVSEAYGYGKTENLAENSWIALKSLFTEYPIEGELTVDQAAVKEKVDLLLEEESAVAVDDSYEISGDQIVIAKGHDGVTAKMSNLLQSIYDQANAKGVTRIQILTDVKEAERVDFKQLYRQVFVQEQDATYGEDASGKIKFKPEVIGTSFNQEEAENTYLNTKDGEDITIKLVHTTPEVTMNNLEEVLFADVLATFQTTYNASNVNRSTNLRIAAEHVNGTILLPGEEFSYNKVVGERTYANGFRDAHVFAGGKVVDGLGGGICQISSTLYNSVLMANLEVTERKNHMMYPEYVKPSLDATVVWGSIDFRFKNNRETPIKLEMTVKNGIATATIYGIKTKNDPIIELVSVIEKTIPYSTVTESDATLPEGTEIITQDPVNGYVSKAYQVFKDESGKELSRKLISSDSYRQTSKIVKVGTMKVEPVAPEGPENPENPSQNPGEVPGTDPNTPDLPTGWDNPENPLYRGDEI